jgi:hypothetical protein
MTRLNAQAPLLAQDWHVAPINAAMISAVLGFADIHRDLGGGRTLMRLSPERVLWADIILLLGRDAQRAADIGLVWNDREDQIVRIIDDATLRASRQAAWEDAFDLFEGDDRDVAPQRLCA